MVRIWPDYHDFKSLSGQALGQGKIIKISGFLVKGKEDAQNDLIGSPHISMSKCLA